MLAAAKEPPLNAQDTRHDRILDLVRRHGFVAIEALAQQFGVTPQTIRRDINALCEQSLLRRYHGGAGLEGETLSLVDVTAVDAS